MIYTNTVTFTHLNYVHTSRHLFISSSVCLPVCLSVCLFLSVCLCLPVCLFTLKVSSQKYPGNFCGYPSWKMRVSETSQKQPSNVRFFLRYIFLICTEYALSYGARYAQCCVYFCVVIIILCLQLFTSSLVTCPSMYQDIPAVIPVNCGLKSSSQSSATITFWYITLLT